ncbi:hypothetical protein AWB78_04559 [Caballeronia calidae]|uniref:Uncharacterized protein n=1 Tax=Caballeronia calidae TaxID=1777139 RepID=A0A158CZT9_9BURK|nr:hypothetical protein AWB78_04559 [Caballeronia calidae]
MPEPLTYSRPLMNCRLVLHLSSTISVLPMRVRYLERIIKGHAYECANRPGKQTALALPARQPGEGQESDARHPDHARQRISHAVSVRPAPLKVSFERTGGSTVLAKIR